MSTLVTTIKIHEQTKHELDLLREHKSESYNDVILKLVSIIRKLEKDPELSQQDIRDIEAARRRIARGEYVTLEKAMERLGMRHELQHKNRKEGSQATRKASTSRSRSNS